MRDEKQEHKAGIGVANAIPMKLEKAEVVAPMLGLTKQALYAAVREGVVPAVKIGKRIRFNPDALAAWAEQGGKAIEA